MTQDAIRVVRPAIRFAEAGSDVREGGDSLKPKWDMNNQPSLFNKLPNR